MSTVTSPDGTRIAYDRVGDGPTVVLVVGATQFRALDQNGARAARLLADAGFTALTYDRRGRGESGDTAPWSIEREAEDLAALIDAVGGPAVPVTFSSGATVAMAAMAIGANIRALALYEPPLMGGRDLTGQLAHLHALIAAEKYDDALRYNLASIIGIPADVVRGMSEQPWWPTMVSGAATLVYDIGSVNEINLDPDWRGRWSGITVPVIVLSGDQTFPGLPEAADAVAAALPTATRRVLAGQSHGPAADVLVPAVVEFLGGR